MKSASPLVLAACALWFASPASADVRTYCEAYARDVANGRVSGGEILNGKIAGTMPETSPKWTEVNGNALAGCMTQYGESVESPAETETASAEEPAPAAKKRTVTRSATATRGALTPGSKAWADYCSKKYSSFNRRTGTYRSLKGQVRPCKVARR